MDGQNNQGQSAGVGKVFEYSAEQLVPQLQAALARALRQPSANSIAEAVFWHDLFLDKCARMDGEQAVQLEDNVRRALPPEWLMWQRYVYRQRERQVTGSQ